MLRITRPSAYCGSVYPSLPRRHSFQVHCTASPEPGDTERPSSSKGKSFSNERRRRGRPAHLRSPDDSPLRDGNRDRLLGLLTERAAKTLAYYLLETNHNMHHWVNRFIQEHPIPRDGNWDDVSGDNFLRTLMAMPIEEAMPWGRDPVFHNTSGCEVDPRSLAQRIMEIRSQLAGEFIADLQQVAEENKVLQLEALQASLLSTEDAIADGSAAARQAATSSSSSSSYAASTSSSSLDVAGNGGGSVFEGGAAAARARARRAKRSVLPSQPTPSNWRLRLEVEAQVHGDGSDGSAATSAAAAAAGLGGGGLGIPDSVQTGIISPTWTPQAPLPPSPEAAAADVSAAAAGTPPSPPPLHPEVAELLPLIKSSPDVALTPDVAQMLSSLAVLSSGQLHPDILQALRTAVAAGARLHPEVAELLKLDVAAAPSAAAAAAAEDSKDGTTTATAMTTDVEAAAVAPPPLASSPSASSTAVPSKPTSVSSPAVPPASLASSTEGAPNSGGKNTAGDNTPVAPYSKVTAEAASASPSVQQVVKEAPHAAVEDSITNLQDDICLHSDEE
ncbi:hypothetical protein Agub_g11734 [Astrephomene gubernaculifera]|uniref:Uncharacterized protein n=1 Tax=Astrephomene gubernaculifera TaxID=47775 RepID=A0AAD3DXD1_9CHLO|nr:hypothetical protein Agub_g11734 [Astrephomene gubernaculifera]